MVATLLFVLRLRIAEAGHLAVFHQNLSGGTAVPLQYILYKSSSKTKDSLYCQKPECVYHKNKMMLLLF